MAKKIIVGLLLVSLLLTLGFVGLITKVTWDQHQDTKDWQHTTLAGDLKDVPPFLARNYIKSEDKDAVQSWQQVSNLLKEIETNKGLNSDKREQAETIIKDAMKWQETYALTSGDVVTQNTRLRLYLDTEQALGIAYEAPSGTVLQDVTNRLYATHVEHPSDINTVYLEKLQVIAKDYTQLAAFLTDTLPTLGAKTNTTLKVSKSVTPNQTKKIQEQINEYQLIKFPFIADLDKLLGGSIWAQILNRNQITKEYETWQKAKIHMEAFSRSMYYSPADITTYKQAIDAGLSVKVNDKDGFTVDENSPVDVILYQGTPVRSDQYIKVGTDVKVLLKELYIEIPKEPEPPVEETTPPTEMAPPTETVPPTEETPPTEEKPPVNPDDGWDEDWGENKPTTGE